jgi:DMSO/TMAO reductase YedYZ molybdopterin-dependent catalytic subunit
MVIFRLYAGISSPVELFGFFLLKHLDAGTFVHMQIVFQPNSKTGPLGLALLAMVVLGTLLGLLYALLAFVRLPVRGYRPRTREWVVALAFAEAMTLVGAILFWNELPQNFLGLPLTWSIIVTIISLFVEFNLYGVVLCLAYRAFLPKERVATTRSGVVAQRRRQLLARTGVAVLGLGAAGANLGGLNTFLKRYSSYDGMKSPTVNGFTPPITPNDLHYVVTQNAVDPTPDINLWRFEVTGLVGKSGSYTYDELQKLPSTSRPITLECISNSAQNHLISTAVWQGVSFKTLLEQHGGAQPQAQYVVFYSSDGYNVTQPLKDVLDADSLLAWRMNGAELPVRHGYPLRALIPGHYGEENVKWLTRLELTDHFVGGLYSDQGWYNGPVHTISRIDRPGGHVAVGHGAEIGGLAYAGTRGIQKVEVSTDDGKSWHVARLQPSISKDSWVMWSWEWTPLMAGTYTLRSRATDGTGAVQTSRDQGSVPHAATGYAKITVQVG